MIITFAIVIMDRVMIVNTYNFWDQDLSKYIYAGIHINCLEPDTFFISRFDSLVYNDGWIFTD